MPGLQKISWRNLRVAFISPRPLAGDEIVSRLDISLGAASQGLKLPRGLGAVNAVYPPGPRRGHLAADLELTGFASVFFKEELRPRLERELERTDHIESLLAQLFTAEHELARQRLSRLRHWLEKGEKICLGHRILVR
jgi:DNA-binding transcriptional regulator GbsR (MarR family)